MVAQDRSTLQSVFETGDVPDGTDYANLIDSFINLVETSAQSIASPVTFAGSAAFTSTTTAASISVLGTASVSGAVTAGSLSVLGAATVSATATFNGPVVAAGTVTADSMSVLGAMRVSAATSLNATTIGGQLTVVTAQTTATASGGAGSTVPTTAVRYLKVVVSGNTYNIPLFASV